MTAHFQSFRPSSLNWPPLTVHFHPRPFTFDLILVKRQMVFGQTLLKLWKLEVEYLVENFKFFMRNGSITEPRTKTGRSRFPNHEKPETKRYFTKSTNPEAHEEFQILKNEADSNSRGTFGRGRSGQSGEPCTSGDRSTCNYMKEKIVKKDGPNNGRRFYSCEGCNYFEWL